MAVGAGGPPEPQKEKLLLIDFSWGSFPCHQNTEEQSGLIIHISDSSSLVSLIGVFQSFVATLPNMKFILHCAQCTHAHTPLNKLSQNSDYLCYIHPTLGALS